MNKKTRNLTLCALLSSLSVISLYVASVWPTGQIGLTAVAALFVTGAIIESGLLFGVYTYIISSFLAVLIVPNRLTAFLFILFFGYYPILKSLIEQLKHKVLQVIIKLLVFNVSLIIIWLLFNEIFLAALNIEIHILLILLLGNIVFLLYDYGFSKIIWLYINRISKDRKSVV